MVKRSKKKDKQLFEEATVRKTMKLAGLKPLTEEFMAKIIPEEEEYEEELMPDEAPLPEEEPVPEEGNALLDLPEEVVEDLVSIVVDAVAEKTGVPIEVESGAEMPEEEPVPEDVPPAEEEVMEEEKELEEGKKELEEGKEELEESKEELEEEKVEERRALGPDHAREARGEGTGHVVESLAKRISKIILKELRSKKNKK